MLETTADLRGLGSGGDCQPAGAPGQRSGGAGVGAVAIAVRLDHRAQLGSRAQRDLQPGAVGLHRAEIDPGKRPHHD